MPLSGDFFDPNTGRLTASLTMSSFICRRSGTVAARSRFPGATNPSSVVVDVSGVTIPVVALVAQGYGAALAVDYTDSGSSLLSFASDAPIGTQFTFYIFDYAPALPEHSAYLLLRDPATNAILFSSNYWPLKAVPLANGATMGTIGGYSWATACAGIGGRYQIIGAYCQGDDYTPEGPRDDCPAVVTTMDGKRYGGRVSAGSVDAIDISYEDTTGIIGDYNRYATFEGYNVANTILAVDVTHIPIGTSFF